MFQNCTPEPALPESTAPEPVLPECTAPEQTLPECTTPEQALPECTTPEQASPESTTPEPVLPECTAPEPALPGRNVYLTNEAALFTNSPHWMSALESAYPTVLRQSVNEKTTHNKLSRLKNKISELKRHVKSESSKKQLREELSRVPFTKEKGKGLQGTLCS